MLNIRPVSDLRNKYPEIEQLVLGGEEVYLTKNGYGAYADPGCHDFFNNCRFDMSNMAAIIAGNSDMTFTDCDADCGTYFALTHCVNGWPEEIADFKVTGGSIHTKKECVLIKSHNAQIDMDGVEIASDSGILVHTILNDDPCKTPVNENVYGVNVNLANMDVRGALVHEDPERPMWVKLTSATLTGSIENANVLFEKGSRLVADKDCTFTLMGEIDPPQIDALPGVTVTVIAKGNETITCAGGGTLVIKEE